eukprot:15435185-Alexandrium_andersonii.AAC.1
MPQEAAAPARPMGQAALSTARNRTSETSPSFGVQLAHFGQRLRRACSCFRLVKLATICSIIGRL